MNSMKRIPSYMGIKQLTDLQCKFYNSNFLTYLIVTVFQTMIIFTGSIVRSASLPVFYLLRGRF